MPDSPPLANNFSYWKKGEKEKERERETKCVCIMCMTFRAFQTYLRVLEYKHQINYELQLRLSLIFLKLGIYH